MKDVKSAGRSKLVPFKHTESYQNRHKRRLTINLLHQNELEGWCRQYGIEFNIGNEGHHWQFRGQKRRADWWPSSGKLVINARWNRGIHCHDYTQVIVQLKSHGFLQKDKAAKTSGA